MQTHEDIMYEYTEWPGDDIPYEDLNFISHRYFRALNFCKSKDILEIGAGSSIGKSEIINHSKSYTGIDLSSQNIKRVSQSFYDKSVSFIIGDAENMQFEDNSFDVIIALAMVYYLDTESFLKEAKRVLRPGGKLFFCTSNKEVPGFVNAPGAKEYLNIEEWSKELSSAGFDYVFEGVFPKQSIVSLDIRARLINFFKNITLNILKQPKLWIWLRNFTKGSLVNIPKDLSDFPECNEQTNIINSNEENYYRVIYVICTSNE